MTLLVCEPNSIELQIYTAMCPCTLDTYDTLFLASHSCQFNCPHCCIIVLSPFVTFVVCNLTLVVLLQSYVNQTLG